MLHQTRWGRPIGLREALGLAADFPASRFPAGFLAAAILLAAPASPAVLQGTIRDAQNHPVTGVSVTLSLNESPPSFSTRSDKTGNYRFESLPAGAYTVRAEAAGSLAVTKLALAKDENKTLDLSLAYAFYDEPNFIVAGVTDVHNRGGHGSDVVLKSAETLSKETAALRSPAPATDKPPLETVHEYQRLAEQTPSEPNLFNWGSELLVHRAPEPATLVFTKGVRLFPESTRMRLGLAASWYARGSYEQAAREFFAACDLDPKDSLPYLFLGKIRSPEITQLDGYTERLARFVQLHPGNAQANYLYAVNLWNRRKSPDDSAPARGLLAKALQLDPHLGPAHLQLGIVYASQDHTADAIAEYRQAIEIDPQMEEAHYRLGQAYKRLGDDERARKELEISQQLARTSAEQAERERSAIPQFVYELRK